MKLDLFFALITLTSSAIAKRSSRQHADFVQHEKRDTSYSNWIKREAVEPELSLPIRIALTQSNLERGHDLLMKTSDPNSPQYGQHYTREEVHDIFAPSEDSIGAVRAWLEEAGISADQIALSDNKQWLALDIPAWKAERLFKTQYNVYEHRKTGKTSVACDTYHVRRDIQHHIDYITPGVTGRAVRMLPHDEVNIVARSFQTERRRIPDNLQKAPASQAAATRGTPCYTSTVVPSCVQSYYGIPTGTTAAKGNTLGIFEPDLQNPLPSDLNDFWTTFAPYIPNGTYPVVDLVDGAMLNFTAPPSFEGSLDFQTAYPIIYPQNATLFLVDSYYEVQLAQKRYGFLDTFLDAIDGSFCTYSAYGQTGDNNTVDAFYPNKKNSFSLQCGVYTPTNVISVSYAVAEFEDHLTSNYYKRQCNEFMKLGMQGVTVLAGSGDQGPNALGECAKVTGKQIYNPDYPSGCPYVVSVGATQLQQNGAGFYESAAVGTRGYASGGGFSNFFPQPSYQTSAVNAFFASSNAPTFPSYSGSTVGNGVYNRSGRAYPDVSAFGLNMPVYMGGYLSNDYGTSFATPIFAAVVTRINEARLAAGKSTVGFINPVLYQNPSAFNDITIGNQSSPSNGPGPGYCQKTYGFSTAVGWDPVTGLGTPNYPALLKVFMSLS